jgi:hypothetical protein
MEERQACTYGGLGVSINLQDARNTERVCWVNGNSYVYVVDSKYPTYETEHGSRVAIVSVNGIGEIRWKSTRWPDKAEREVADYFRLTLLKETHDE